MDARQGPLDRNRPLTIGALCLAFWRRSLVWGLVIVNAAAIGKVMWGVVLGDGAGWAMLLPALAGLLVCDAAVLYAARRIRAGSSRRGREREAEKLREGTTL